jgi:hypothetical protein
MRLRHNERHTLYAEVISTRETETLKQSYKYKHTFTNYPQHTGSLVTALLYILPASLTPYS